jgi:hypothetical protein
MTTVTMTVTGEQAQCIADALDLYCRIGLGQIDELAEMAAFGFIVPCDGVDPADVADQMRPLCNSIKRLLGHPPHGNYGIGHDRVPVGANRAFEIKKQVAKALAIHRDPSPSFRGVDYDGRSVQYTPDPDIAIEVTE